MQQLVHYGLHFLLPIAIALVFYRSSWKKVTLIFWATMFVDLDHLLADPIFMEDRCSINFHPLHTYWAMVVYVMMFFSERLRILSLGLLMHMLADFVDCLWMKY